MKTSIRLLTIILLVMASSHPVVAAATTRDILRQADQSRGNLEGITWEVLLTSIKKKRTETMSFEVKARGFDILATTLSPPKSQGNRVLMINGNMWFHKPRLSKPVPISQRQKLLGQAAYGDIASTNYAEDYDATLLAEERVDDELCYVFDLQAKDKKATYDQIKYWISKDRLVGVKAEYFTVSGKKFKSATMVYAHEVTIEEAKRPFVSAIRIQDELIADAVTTLSFEAPRFEDLPNYVFNLNLFVR